MLEARGDTWRDTQSCESSSAKLSQHCHSLIRTKTDAAGENAAPALLHQTDSPLAVSTLTTYLLPFHLVSSNVPTVLTQKAAQLVGHKVRTGRRCVLVLLLHRYCTFLTGQSDPAVQAAAAAAALVALGPVLTLAGLAAVWPVSVHTAV